MITGINNAGYDIIEAMYYNSTAGYCLGRNKHQYVTWWFTEKPDGSDVSFYHGNYFPIDADSPLRSAARAKADYCHRLCEAFHNIAEYGY